MMKKLFITWMLMMPIGLMACMSASNNASQTRNVSGFTEIRVEGVATVIFIQGDTYSCRVEGSEAEVKELVTTVKGKTLFIENKNKRRKEYDVVEVYVSAPRLEKVNFDAVGTFRSKGRLKADDISFDFDGVGSLEIEDLHARSVEMEVDGVGEVDVQLDCDFLDACFDGVGSVSLSGCADTLKLSKGGVGSVATNGLKTKNLIGKW